MKRVLFLGLAFLFVGLGAVGAVLPILPTVPFLLLASFFFAKGSKRYHTWFTGTRLYRRHLRDFAESRSMTRRTKLSILLPVTALLVAAGLAVPNLPMRICLGCLILVKYWYFLFRIKTIPAHRPGEEKGRASASQHSNQ